MPSIKGLRAGLLSRTKSSNSDTTSPASDDSPEGNAQRGVRLFCESGSISNQGEEVLHLPVIVEAAESSPAAATACAQQIRKFLSKDNFSKPHVQYNAIMLLRILSENPGPTFTRNIDRKFVDTTANLLKTGKDPSVQQILRETLDALEAERYNDEGLKKLLEMWRMNKGSRAVIPTPNSVWASYPSNVRGDNGNSGGGSGGTSLPSPVELASRVEEGRNTAKILMQLVQSTPPEEVLGNELLKEFAERCQSAQRSMQGFINCDNPPPDDDTLQTLIEVNEQLSLSLSKHQRAVLTARRAAGLTSAVATPDPESQGGSNVYTRPSNDLTSAEARTLQAAGDRVSGRQDDDSRQRTEARARMEAREAEQERQDRLKAPEPAVQQFSPPSGPPPGRFAQDPFGDGAERSSLSRRGDRFDDTSVPTGVETHERRQPVTYRY